MLHKEKSSIMPGVFLIVIGLWLFLRQFSFFSFYWDQIYPILLVILGLSLLVEFLLYKKSGTVFWSVISLIIGIFFILRNFEIIPYFYADEYWPVFLVAIGFGFVSLYLTNPKDWGILIPACLFLFFGIGFLVHTLDNAYWEWIEFLKQYWPIAIILAGSVFVIDAMTHRKIDKK